MNYLQKFRKEKGLSTTQFASKCKVRISEVVNIETGRTRRVNKAAKKISELYNLDPTDLLTSVMELEPVYKKCLNQKCPLNKNCSCQSPQVTRGKSFCRSEHKVTEKEAEEIIC